MPVRKRKKSKAGRPRKEGPREANGQRVRSYVKAESERSAVETAIEARKRVFGMTEAQAKDPDAGSVIGRMRMEGRLSRDQLDAAQRFIEVTNGWQRSIDSKPHHNQPRAEVTPDGEQTHEDWCQDKRKAFADMQAALEEVCQETRSQLPRKALDMIVLRDIEVPHFDGELRTALNRLHRHFFERRSKKAA